MHSAIYQGNLRHRRFHPKRHEFTYSSTLFYIDLDELSTLFSGIRGWSLNRRNLGSFWRKDYLGDPQIPLKDAVRNKVQELMGYCPAGPVRMLTNLRIWGFCFNPVTLYYVFEVDADCPALFWQRSIIPLGMSAIVIWFVAIVIPEKQKQILKNNFMCRPLIHWRCAITG
ncbi:DUF1365 family protein [Cellvibrio mixtus]|uniref:DUF1365 family protein n=1 Tax=Cellvibrio mixtus TaxID=39650 RepID=UPI001BAEA7D9|nr:DUF1365 family protein [Cellvibrio mixtus]